MKKLQIAIIVMVLLLSTGAGIAVPAVFSSQTPRDTPTPGGTATRVRDTATSDPTATETNTDTPPPTMTEMQVTSTDEPTATDDPTFTPEPPTATPTAVDTPTPRVRPTTAVPPSPTERVRPTLTLEPTNTPDVDFTHTPTITRQPTATGVLPSPTITRWPTPTPTGSRSSTSTPYPTLTPSPVRTPTRTPEPVRARVALATIDWDRLIYVDPSATPTPTPSLTPTIPALITVTANEIIVSENVRRSVKIELPPLYRGVTFLSYIIVVVSLGMMSAVVWQRRKVTRFPRVVYWLFWLIHAAVYFTALILNSIGLLTIDYSDIFFLKWSILLTFHIILTGAIVTIVTFLKGVDTSG